MLRIKAWQIGIVAIICIASALFAAPNLFSRQSMQESYPSWLPTQQVSLGLDLQGGSHLLLEVELDSLVREKIGRLVDGVRRSLRKAKIRYVKLEASGSKVVFRLTNVENFSKAEDALTDLLIDFEMVASADGNVEIEYTADALRELRVSSLNQSIEIIRRRIDETGVREPTIQRQGEDRVLVQLPGVDDPERMKALIGKTARLTFHMVDHTVSESDIIDRRLPPGTRLLESDDEVDAQGNPLLFPVRKKVELTGEALADAQPSFQDNEPVVSFRFDTSGGKKFGKITQDNVGRPFAIVLDGKVISAPRINEPILGGSGIISGSFTAETARDLALLLRAGALPAPMNVLEERTVGPGLGADSIRAGTIACLIGLLAVIAFMVMYYGLFGLVANIALLLNLVIIIALLSLLQATLTLPGIAGIVLTIGMAVDSNVLIFERIREEVRSGRPPFSAMEAGYKQAFRTIFDSNLTTLIAAVILYLIGSGPVKGFAVTLGFGIVTSMFTAMIVSRYILVAWLRSRRPNELPV